MGYGESRLDHNPGTNDATRVSSPASRKAIVASQRTACGSSLQARWRPHSRFSRSSRHQPPAAPPRNIAIRDLSVAVQPNGSVA
jgi:hypothetical protein